MLRSRLRRGAKNNCAKQMPAGLCDTSITSAVTRQNIYSFAGCCPPCWLVGDRKKAAAVLSKTTSHTAGCASQLVLTRAPARKVDVPVILAYEEVTSRPQACWLIHAFAWEACLAHDSIKFIIACYAEFKHAGRYSGHLPDGFHALLPGLVFNVW